MEISTTFVEASTNDIVLDDSKDIRLVSGQEAAANIIRSAILTNKGELKFFQNLGVPYFSTVFLSRKLAPLWVDYVTRRVKEFDFVNDVTKFDYRYDSTDNTMKYEMTVNTIFGILSLTNQEG